MNKYKLCIIINCVALVAHIINNIFINSLWIRISFVTLSVLTIFVFKTTWFDKLFICKPKDKYDAWEIEHDVKLNKWFIRTKAKDKARGYQYIQHLPNVGIYQLHSKSKGYGKDTHEEALKLLDDYLYSLIEDIRVYPIKPKLDDNLS